MTHEASARLERISASLASLSRDLSSVISELKPKPTVTIKRKAIPPMPQTTSTEPEEFIVSSKPEKRAKQLLKAREKIVHLEVSAKEPGKLAWYRRFVAHLETL